MLTEIEWWGGILTIWFVVCYLATYAAFKGKSKLSLSFIVSNLAFLCCVFVLALFFYPLESAFARQFYLALLAGGIVFTALMFLLPDDDEQQAEEDDDEAAGSEWLGIAILFFPFGISILLGLYKSYPLVGALGWLG